MKRRHQTWHLRLWVILSLALPLLLLLTVLGRQERPVEPVADYLTRPAEGAAQ
ncbi:hypothetical protein NUH88_14125 [Nisaea acidiphila]|uniref:Uncharacterized protein n=1 Tax=Nisaea acidiphila TaxID=1862145 RepID=A0A9J7ANN0_9PROT|nr:hypothetical protein [Nisaea acidiphila]UUX48546.1 hypothetical protein NUH88_14125 [Nisaea acidiphila]